MNDKNKLTEVERLASEIELLRNEVRNINSTINRIEKRLKSHFPNYPAKKKAKPIDKKNIQNIPRDELMETFNIIVERTRKDGETAFNHEIQKLDKQFLLNLADELGLGSKKSLSIKKAREGIRGRVQESIQLT